MFIVADLVSLKQGCFILVQKYNVTTIHHLGLDAKKTGVIANNTGADQPANPGRVHSLISAFVIRLLEGIISKLETSKFKIF